LIRVVVVDNLLVNADVVTDSCSFWQADVIVAVQVYTRKGKSSELYNSTVKNIQVWPKTVNL